MDEYALADLENDEKKLKMMEAGKINEVNGCHECAACLDLYDEFDLDRSNGHWICRFCEEEGITTDEL